MRSVRGFRFRFLGFGAATGAVGSKARLVLAILLLILLRVEAGEHFLAALAIGDVERGDIDAWNPVASEIVPNATLRSLYYRHYGVFRGLYDSTRQLMREIEA